MKNFLNSTLSICFLAFVAFLTPSTNTFAQKKITIVPSVVPPGGGGGPVPDEPPSNLINCNLTNGNQCNLIPNNTFNTICTDTYKPFVSCINFWTSSHGTPQLNQYPPQLSTTTNHASMWARAYMNSSGNIISEGEGIAVGIPHLITNRSYTLSFFKKIYTDNGWGAPDIDNYYLVLLKCPDFNAIRVFGENYTIPTIPSSAQIIYQESNASNFEWQNVTQTFTANDEYNVLWIFPRNTTANIPGVTLWSWLEFAYPEIKDNVNCTPPGCTTPTVSPTGPIEYHYLWESPWIGKTLTSSSITGNQWYKNGVAIPNANTAIFVAKEAGNYYTKVGNCQSNTVSITGYPYYASPPQFGQHIIPVQSPGYYCTNSFEPIRLFNLGSSATYTWNTNPYPWVPSSLSINPSTYNINSPSATLVIGNIGGTFTIQGTASLNGTEKVLDYHLLLTPQSSPQNLTVCASSTNYFGPPDSNPVGSLPGSSGFTWEYYDFGPNSIITFPNPSTYPDPSDPTNIHKIRIPGNSPLSNYIAVKFTGTSYVKFQASYSWGGCYNETLWNVTTISGCFTEGNNNSNNSLASIIYPNPASNQINITSTNAIIKEVEIFGLFNNSILKIMGNKSKMVATNISILQEGIYTCRITTDKGVENQKLIIKR